MVITSKLRRHKVMERAMRALMGNNLPPRFKFKDTYDSIEVPTTHQQHLPSQATLEAKFDELIAEEEVVAPTTQIKADMVVSSNLEVGTSNLFVDTETGNVGIGTPLPAYKLNVVADSGDAEVHIQAQGNAGDSIIYFNGSHTSQRKCAILSSNVAPASWCKQDLHFCHNTDSNYDDVTIADSKMVITNVGNVGIGTVSPTKSLEIDGTTLRHAYEYRYQDSWTSNNNQTFTIPVTGLSARGEMLVEAEVIQVAANSSSERMARVKGIITNYHTGTFNMTVFEGENATAFETYIVGTSGSAAGTFTMKYRPQVGYLQNVLCRLNLKIFIGGFTSSLGSLTRTDAGSNSALTAPTLNSATKIFGGNVGIGTNNPLSQLDIKAVKGITTAATVNDLVSNATIRISGYAENHDALCIGMLGTDTSGNSGNNPYAYIQNIWDTPSTARPLLLNPAGGNVGIGTTNPGYKLNVLTDTNYDGISLRDSTRELVKIAKGNNGAYINMFESSVSKVNISTNGNNWLNGGNVGIGTTSPDGRLHICSGTSGDCHLILHADTDNNNETDNPKIMFRQDAAIYTAEIGIDNSGNKLAIRGTSGIAFYDGGTSSTDINHLESTSTERMRIEAGGNVGIGTASPGYKLHVNGDIYATGNITGYSDKRAKSDIQKIENALDKIDKLNGYTFTMNDKRYTGVIAQEVLPVLPEAVTGSEETHYAVAYGNMMGLIIEAIKELKKKIEQ